MPAPGRRTKNMPKFGDVDLANAVMPGHARQLEHRVTLGKATDRPPESSARGRARTVRVSCVISRCSASCRAGDRLDPAHDIGDGEFSCAFGRRADTSVKDPRPGITWWTPGMGRFSRRCRNQPSGRSCKIPRPHGIAAPPERSRRSAIGTVPAWPRHAVSIGSKRVAPAIAVTTPTPRFFAPAPAPARLQFGPRRAARGGPARRRRDDRVELELPERPLGASRPRRDRARSARPFETCRHRAAPSKRSRQTARTPRRKSG